MKRCNHKMAVYAWRGDVAVSRHCAVPQREPGVFGCGALLSRGEANDASLDVQVEIDAAAIAARVQAGGSPQFTNAELAGAAADESHAFATFRGWQVGWLAAEILTPQVGWPWDPSRPVAGQYEEHLAATAQLRGDLVAGSDAVPDRLAEPELPQIEPMPDILRCADCGAEHGSSAAAEAGWTIVDGKPYCAGHRPIPPVVVDGAEVAEVPDIHDEPTHVGPAVAEVGEE